MGIKTVELLLKLKNAAFVKKKFIFVNYNKFNFNLIVLLYKQGYLQSYLLIKKQIKVYIRYVYNFSFIQNIRIVSNSSRKFFFSYHSLCYLKNKMRLFCFSTSFGIDTLLDCKKHRIGGLLLFIC